MRNYYIYNPISFLYYSKLHMMNLKTVGEREGEKDNWATYVLPMNEVYRHSLLLVL